MPPKFVPTPQQNIDATRFVAYELWMLRECADMPKPRTQAEKNVWYEALVLHTRVLRDFFFTKISKDGKRVTRDTDIVAVDYFRLGMLSWPYTSDDLPAYLKSHKDRMDWALAHLTFGRLDVTGSKKAWDAGRMRFEIGEKWFEFIEKCQAQGEPALASFIQEAKRRNVPVTAPF